jgi:hypothetical protein
MKVLRAIAKDDSKAKRKKPKERSLPPGTILSWRDVWTMLKLQKMNEDTPMLLKLPLQIALGERADGSVIRATHIGFAIDDLDHLKIDFFQIDENGITDLDVMNLENRKRVIPN